MPKEQPDESPSAPAESRSALSTPKSEATRLAILAAARTAFTLKGFAGTSIADITAGSNISRANFYYYFADKHALFIELGTATYYESIEAARSFAELPKRPDADELRRWVESYFAYLDRNGSFMMRSAEAGPDDPGFRDLWQRLESRMLATLGAEFCARAGTAFTDQIVVGTSLTAMLQRSWFQCQHGPAHRDRTITTLAEMLHAQLS